MAVGQEEAPTYSRSPSSARSCAQLLIFLLLSSPPPAPRPASDFCYLLPSHRYSVCISFLCIFVCKFFFACVLPFPVLPVRARARARGANGLLLENVARRIFRFFFNPRARQAARSYLSYMCRLVGLVIFGYESKILQREPAIFHRARQ